MDNYPSRLNLRHGLARNRSSMAQIVSNTLIMGQAVKPSSMSLSRGQGQLIKPQSPEGEVVEDMYLEEILHGEESSSSGPKRKHNVRANLGFFRLLLHDFQIWRKRWKNKQIEQPFFRKQIKEIESNFGSSIGALFVFTRWVLLSNLVLSVLWLSLVVTPMAVSFPYSNVTQGFALGNIIDGQGVLGEAWLFYGGYQDRALGGHYPLALAYLLLIVCTYFGTLFVIMKSMGRAASPQSATAAESRFKFSLMTLSSWDYSVTSPEASLNLSKGIVSMFKDHIYEVKAKEAAEKSTEKTKLIMYRILAWIITILIIGGACTTIVFLVIFVNFSDSSAKTNERQDDFLHVYGTTLTFSLINMLVPPIITKLPGIERYSSGKLELSITLSRVFCLRMANLFALIVTLYSRLTKLTYDCTGTVIGQELYKLVVMDTLVHCVGQLGITYIRFFWTQEKTEFLISGPALVLIYRQGLIWVGTLACPLLPLVGVFSDLIFFYVNYRIVTDTCRPPLKRWRQSRSTGFLTVFLLVTLVLIIIPVSVVIGSQQVINLGHSTDCGPFGQQKPTSVYTEVQEQQPVLLREVMKWAVSDSVLLPLFLLLLAYIFYQRVLIAGEKKHRLILQAELLQESEDNAELLGKLQGVPSGF
uniref:Transmembrane channel-like protein 7 n=1 Tax=Crassostrea virginica TaxID=6565 RepID=A0A8B8C0P3_CRAVI|nr:transmembrane channel-like protein 7 [Crassostrea virginica]